MLLQDKTAVIYGGGGAIGSAVARVFAREGARVFVGGRSMERLDRVISDISTSGGIAQASQIDVLDEQAVDEHAAMVAAEAGGIDIALNAVSFPHDQGTPIADLSQETFMLPVDRFLRALFITSKAVAPYMGLRRQGVILTLSAPGATMAAGGHLGHAASMAGTEAFSRVLADELGPRNIRVVCMRPHAIADAPAVGSYTGALFAPKAEAMGLSVKEWLGGAAQATMLRRLPRLDDVSETAAFLASDRAAAMTGAVANLTCGAIAD
ncbi:SDR family oxidoreductase [Mesorhizobium microcysteis]|uniref:SDR family oxidoreductase n=1 Tax=Neoaquamicrobium microcysteis TaxID=2682781 RepID=A0A5D4GTA9_9HYPH|nr:SDR family oxidoreductase [Mesorhizobium microcysteis]TYR30515.1 SDR family oxidoreductase [Mesorhizobium microcysteis]